MLKNKLTIFLFTALISIPCVYASEAAPARYNIAWICEDQNLNHKFVEVSHNLCAHLHDGYLLGAKSLPHISICQFECNNIKTVQAISAQLKNNTDLFFPKLAGISCLPGEGEFAGSVWIELALLREQALIDAQNKMAALLKTFGITTLNSLGSTYRPHLTLAKITQNCFWNISFMDFSKFISLHSRKISFKIAVGVADQNWQFVEII